MYPALALARGCVVLGAQAGYAPAAPMKPDIPAPAQLTAPTRAMAKSSHAPLTSITAAPEGQEGGSGQTHGLGDVPPIFHAQGVRLEQWNDWHWQQANRLRSAVAIEAFWPLSANERRACVEATSRFRMAVTPYYFSLIDPQNADDPIRRQCIPVLDELRIADDELEDPLAEEAHMPVPGLTHRYSDRALLYTTHNCPVYCRHCFRKRKVSDPESAAPYTQIDAGVEYIENNTAVRDVLISGGDPLTFSNARLDALLGRLSRIDHVDVIRLATRNPVTLPQRIDAELAAMVRQYRPIYVQTQFNHLQECTAEAARALEALADAGCVLNNQMVLLKGINDAADGRMVRQMNRWLLRHRCQPYYIFQCDSAQGIGHFRTPIASGLQLLSQLRGHISGLAVPHYVVDLPGGGGKVSLQADVVVAKEGRRWSLRNHQGRVFDYVEGAADDPVQANAVVEPS